MKLLNEALPKGAIRMTPMRKAAAASRRLTTAARSATFGEPLFHCRLPFHIFVNVIVLAFSPCAQWGCTPAHIDEIDQGTQEGRGREAY